MPEIIDLVFAKTSPKRSFSLTENERFEPIFANTLSIHSGTGLKKKHLRYVDTGTKDTRQDPTFLP